LQAAPGRWHPLLLASGKPSGAPFEEMRDAEQVDDRRKIGMAVGRRREEAAVTEVLRDGEMRKQPGVLDT